MTATTCAQCGAHLPVTAGWCSQCYAPVTSGAPGAPNVAAPTQQQSRSATQADPRFASWSEDSLTAPPPVLTAPAPTAAPPRAPASRAAVPTTRPASLTPVAAEPSSPIAHPALLVGTAIALGGAFQWYFWVKSKDWQIEPSTAIRYSLIGTVAFYVVIALIVLYQMRRPLKPLVWSRATHPIPAILLGLTVGGGVAALVVATNSARAGHLRTDPFASLVVSEHDIIRTAFMFLLLCVAAPIVEETLFRGVLFEWLSHRDVNLAFVVSALAFALWHWRLDTVSLVYYAIMGLTLAKLYHKGGLLSSMAGHAVFNGTLLAVAIVISMTPGPHVRVGDFSMQTAAGWQTVTPKSGSQMARVLAITPGQELTGPSGAGLLVLQMPAGLIDGTPQQVADELNDNAVQINQLASSVPGLADLDATVGEARVTTLGDSPAIIRSVKAQGQLREDVYVFSGQTLYAITFASSGSSQATHDFEHMLTTIRTGAN